VQNFGLFDLNNQTNNAATDPMGLFTGLTSNNTLQLKLSDVLTENGALGPLSPKMTILGDDTSTVDLLDAGWVKTNSTETVGGALCDVWHNDAMKANTMADLLIQQGVGVHLI